jgi:hypothetical protein
VERSRGPVRPHVLGTWPQQNDRHVQELRQVWDEQRLLVVSCVGEEDEGTVLLLPHRLGCELARSFPSDANAAAAALERILSRGDCDGLVGATLSSAL